MTYHDAEKMLSSLFERCDSAQFIELRPIRRGLGALSPEFFPLSQIGAAARRAVQLRDRADVYFGVAPRTRRAGGKDAVDQLPAAWADVDSAEALDRLRAFPLKPTFTIASGTSDNVHAYWVLEQPVAPDVGERLNRAVAAALAADERATDAARVLRLPGTLNHKSVPPAAVVLQLLDGARVTCEQLDQAVRACSLSTSGPAARTVELAPTELLLEKLDGVSGQGPQWMARCPGHDDVDPSLSITQGEDGLPLLNCFAGCAYDDILDAMDGDTGGQVRRGAQPPPTRAHDRVMALVQADDVQLFHDAQERPHALVRVGGRSECLEVGSQDFRQWVRRAYYQNHTAAVPGEALGAAIELIEAKARYDGPERSVHRRVGGDLEQLCIDLADSDRRVVVISRDGSWEVTQDPPVLFVREHGMLPLPLPERGGSIEELRPLLNMTDERNWSIYRGCLLAAFHPFGPYFVLAISGRAGSGKSSQARYFARLVDPYQAQFIVGTPKPSDLIIAAARSWLIGLDNVSRISRDLSDVLCTLSTGAGDRKRALYTNADAYALEAKRPSLLTSIARPATRPDLVDRSASITLESLKERRRETELDHAFNQRRPRVFGAMLDALAGALRDLDHTIIDCLPRMADAAAFVTAAEPTLEVSQGTFLSALAAAKGDALSDTAHSLPFITAVIKMMENREEFYDSPTALLAQAADCAGDQKHSRAWPSTAGMATTQLLENSLSLEHHGITAEVGIREPGDGRARRTRLTRRP